MGDPHRDAPDLVGQIGRLLNHRIDAAQFWLWFAAAMPAIEDTALDPVVDLAWRVEQRFAEYSSGYIDEALLIATLARDVAEFDVIGKQVADAPIAERGRSSGFAAR